MENVIEICGQSFDRDSEHFAFEWPFTDIEDMAELDKLRLFPQLRSVSLGSTNINDLGLQYVCKNPNIDNLNLQDTQITNEGIRCLAELKGLKYLRLKENWQLDNGCIEAINQLQSLVDLQLHETSIDGAGIKAINLVHLRDLMVNETEDSILRHLSHQLPRCRILIKGKAEWLNGTTL